MARKFGNGAPGHQPAAAAGVFGGPLSSSYGRNAGIAWPKVRSGAGPIYPSLSPVFYKGRNGVQTIGTLQRTASLVLRGGNNG